MTMYIGYGGTFDPIHNGHLKIAGCAVQALKAPVYFIPAADPPHRPPPAANAMQRLAMLKRALAEEDTLDINMCEIERARQQPGQPSWTVDTLRSLRAQIGPHTPLVWLLGADSLHSLPTWQHWQQLLHLAHLVVAPRPGSPLDENLPPVLEDYLRPAWIKHKERLYQHPSGYIWHLQQPLHQQSATAIRQYIACGDNQWQTHLPASVAAYIIKHRLYGYL